MFYARNMQMRIYANSETNDRSALFFFTSFAFGFFRRKVTSAIAGVSAAYPMLSIAIVPALSFEFFTSFA